MCYWSDLILDPQAQTPLSRLYGGAHDAVHPPARRSVLAAALPAIPYMRANLSLKRTRLAEATR